MNKRKKVLVNIYKELGYKISGDAGHFKVTYPKGHSVDFDKDIKTLDDAWKAIIFSDTPLSELNAAWDLQYEHPVDGFEFKQEWLKLQDDDAAYEIRAEWLKCRRKNKG